MRSVVYFTLGEYITSFIGKKTPFPSHLLSPDNKTGKGTDSGHGESDEDRAIHSSSSESDDIEDVEELKWKRGRLLGKGAFGKVTDLLS